jgi:hypothetical protein
MQVIDAAVAKKVLGLLDHGLTSGLGEQEPGKMCVEAAICYALDLPHGDDPGCVLRPLRYLKIKINDARWSSNMARAKGLKRLALAQLGSDKLDAKEFAQRVATMTIRIYVPLALRAAASRKGNAKHKEALEAAAELCEKEPTRESARKAREVARTAYAAAAAYATAYAAADAYAAAAAAAAADAYAADAADADATSDSVLASFCEQVVGILIEMKAPGCQWLGLTVQ